MTIDDAERATLRYAARVLGDFTRRCREAGVYVPLDVAALAALLANGRQSAPQLDTEDGGMDRLLVSYEQAARVLNVSPRSLSRLVAAGAIPRVRVGGTQKIAVDDLRAYVAGLERRRGVDGGAQHAAEGT